MVNLIEQKNIENLAPAVVLGSSYTGYGVIRSIAEFDSNIQIVVFEREIFRPEAKTKLAKIVRFNNEYELIEKLVAFSLKQDYKPVLFLTSDWFVSFFMNWRDVIIKYYHIDLPSNKIIEKLLNKDKFCKFARKHNFKIPNTTLLNKKDTDQKTLEGMKFPCILKPIWRDNKWKKAKFPKVFIFKEKNELLEKLNIVFKIHDCLIAQEWIPGADSDIYFSLVYYDNQSNMLSEFSGRKIRQFPIKTGSTSCAELFKVPFIIEETKRFFDIINYKGFGSLEFKQHHNTAEYYIIEPTVGRPDHQSYIATINGLNMPILAYCSTLGLNFKKRFKNSKPTIWVDDQFDPLSLVILFFKRKLRIGDLIKYFFQRKKFRFFNFKDLRPFVFLIRRACIIIWNKVF